MDLSIEWAEAVVRARERCRVLVLGATDVGKTTFVQAVLAGCDPHFMLIDLDPGQKMIGPPGTVTLGQLEPCRIERFVFIGSTSSSRISPIVTAAAELAHLASRSGSFIANTSGFVKGLGARLQAATIRALKPDLIVEIAAEIEEPSLLPARCREVPAIRLLRSSLARRKSAGARARLRQEAFMRALSGAELRRLPPNLSLEPGPVAPLTGVARPVCSIANPDGVDLAYGILDGADEQGVRVLTHGPVDGAADRVRIGRMWAQPAEGRWRLLDKLEPAWVTRRA